MRLNRFPNQEVDHAFEIRVVGRDASEAVMPHDGEIEGVVGEKAVFLLDVMAVADVSDFERKDLDTDSLNGRAARCWTSFLTSEGWPSRWRIAVLGSS